MWEEISAIAGVISAVCAVVSIGYLSANRETRREHEGSSHLLTARSLFSFLLATSGWMLLVLSWLWIFEPFGPYVRRDEYLQLVGIVLALPALLVFVWGWRLHSEHQRRPARRPGSDSNPTS
jgi:hypothetical protein